MTPRKNPNAVALGRKGGKMRAKKLSPAELRKIGQKGAEARWGKRGGTTDKGQV